MEALVGPENAPTDELLGLWIRHVIDAEAGHSDIPILEVWNKADLLDETRFSELAEAAAGQNAVLVSATKGQGLEGFFDRIAQMLTEKASELTVTLPVSDGRRIAWLHAHGEVVEDEDAGEGESGPQRRMTVRLNPKEMGQYASL